MKKLMQKNKILFVLIGLFIILFDYTYVENSIFHKKSIYQNECNKVLNHIEHFHSDFFENKVYFTNPIESKELTLSKRVIFRNIKFLSNNISQIWQPPKLS